MWSLGCVLAEFYIGRPIFPGRNELDQLSCITEVKTVLENLLSETNTNLMHMFTMIVFFYFFRYLDFLLPKWLKNLKFGLTSLVNSIHSHVIHFQQFFRFFFVMFCSTFFCLSCSIKAQRGAQKGVHNFLKTRPLVVVLGSTDYSFLDFIRRCLTYVSFNYFP